MSILENIIPTTFSNTFADHYQIKNLDSVAEWCYNIWKEKKLDKSKLSIMEMSEIVEETDIFFLK